MENQRKQNNSMNSNKKIEKVTNSVSKMNISTTKKPLNEQEKKTKKMELIAESLSKVDNEINQGIMDYAQSLSEKEIIILFNQTALDFFNFAIEGTRRLKREREFGFSGYLNLYERAVKANMEVPIDQFTVIVLEFAHDIYNKNENFFLDLHIPDAELKDENKNEFNIIRSDEFKKLWKVLDEKDKNEVIQKIIALTTYAHTYFYKLALKMSK